MFQSFNCSLSELTFFSLERNCCLFLSTSSLALTGFSIILQAVIILNAWLILNLLISPQSLNNLPIISNQYTVDI